jgi:tetratricopeptide (TPR) repeat protein
MKKLTLALLVPCLAAAAYAAEFQAEAYFTEADGGNFRAYITAATDTQVRYKLTSVSTNFEDAKISDYTTIFVVRPEEYSEAMDLYEAGKYKEAQEKFRVYKDFSKPIAPLKGNYHTLSAFHEMECMRRLGDLDGIAAALKDFSKKALTNEYHLRQLDLYVMWDAVRAESWDRVLSIASERDSEALPGYQRAQIGYCKGLALQKLGRIGEALTQYAVAMTADSGASDILTNKAALNSLQMYLEDEEVKFAMSVWGTPDESKNSNGRTMLLEANVLASEYEALLGLGDPLPGSYKPFLKYTN